jgi:hypothetical protein
MFDFTQYPPEDGVSKRFVAAFPCLRRAAAVKLTSDGNIVVAGDSNMDLPKEFEGRKVHLLV